MVKEFKVKFWGVRGSYPVPSANMLKYGGNTACVEVRVNGHIIILDAGTGIIELGNDLLKTHIAGGTSTDDRKPIKATVLFSHSHIDHLQGLPFFKPAYITSSKIHLFGGKSSGRDFKELVSENLFKQMFPLTIEDMPAEVKIANLSENEAIILDSDSDEPKIVQFHSEEEIKVSEDGVIITNLKSYAHPKDGVNIFKIKCNGKVFVYATDTETTTEDTKLIDFCKEANLLIHDSQYTKDDYYSPVSPKKGFGHSTLEMAIETAVNSNVSQLVLFHLDPSYDDKFIEKLEEKAKGTFSNSAFAYENLEISLI